MPIPDALEKITAILCTFLFYVYMTFIILHKNFFQYNTRYKTVDFPDGSLEVASEELLSIQSQWPHYAFLHVRTLDPALVDNIFTVVLQQDTNEIKLEYPLLIAKSEPFVIPLQYRSSDTTLKQMLIAGDDGLAVTEGTPPVLIFSDTANPCALT